MNLELQYEDNNEDHNDEDHNEDILKVYKNYPAIDEVYHLLQHLQHHTNESLHKQLFCLVCGIAGNSITEDISPDTPPLTIYQLVHKAFIQTINNWPKKMYAQDKLFQYLDGNIWPQTFLDFISTMNKIYPPCTFMSENEEFNELDISEKVIAYFGFKVWDTHQSTRTVVNSKLGPHYNNKVFDRSGHNRSGVLHAIRVAYWESRQEEKSEKSVDNNLAYAKKKLTKGKKFSRATKDGMPEDYYPEEWLTFILLGKPAEDRALNSYVLTQGEKRKGMLIHHAKDIGRRFNKKARHTVGDTAQTPPSKESSTPTVIIKHQFVGRENDNREILECRKIEAKEQHISVVERIIARNKEKGMDVREREMELDKLYEELSNLYGELSNFMRRELRV